MIKIEKQFLGAYRFTVTIAGEIIADFLNARPEIFENRTVYTGDNQYQPANAYLNNFEILTNETADDLVSEMASVPTGNRLPGNCLNILITFQKFSTLTCFS